MSEKFVLRNGWIENEQGDIVAIIPENVEREDRAIIENSLSAVQIIKEFVDDVNKNGVFKPRAQVKKFEQFLNKLEL